jgi:hypothetical protein
MPVGHVKRFRGLWLRGGAALRLGMLVFGCVVVCLCWACAGALGALTRLPVRLFGALASPQGIGVDDSSAAPSSGFVYVADAANHRVQVFTSAGVFVLMFGDDVNKNLLEPDVCKAGEECQAGVSGAGAGAFVTPEFVAVDNDPSSLSYHDVYVADTGDNLVSKFTPAGVLVAAWGNNGSGGTANGQLNGSATTLFGSIAGVAVGATGTLYVMNTENPNRVFEFEPDSTLIGELELSKEVLPLGLAVNGEGHLFKLDAVNGIVEYPETGEEPLRFLTISGLESGTLTSGPEGGLYFAGLAGTLDHYAFNGTGEVLEQGGATCVKRCNPTDSTSVGFVASGIGVGSGGDVFLSNATTGEVEEYGLAVTLPDVVTGAATEVKPTSVQVNGTVNPEGLPATECVFEYGETTSYGKTAACEEPSALELSGSSPVPVHAVIEGLSPGVVYHFRLIARNANDPGPANTPNPGSDESFKTPPRPSIDSATVTGLSATSAVLNASINPHEAATTYHFEYDTRPYLKAEAPHGRQLPEVKGKLVEGKLAPASRDEEVSQPIPELVANKTYYWRVVATNASGTTTSVGHSFVYETAGRELPDGRAYEMVTPNRKNGSLIGDVSISGVQPDIAADGQQVMAMAIQCFAGAESCNAQQADNVGSPYEFTRTASGWVTTPLSPPASEFTQDTGWAYSAQEGTALFSMPTAPSGENDLYKREPSTAKFVDIGPDTPPEDGPHAPSGGKASAIEQAYTTDFSHLAWDAQYLWASPFLVKESTSEVFEYVGTGNTRPFQVGVVGGKGSHELVSDCGTNLGPAISSITAPGSMSVTGETVFFTALPEGTLGPCPTGALGEVKAPEVLARIDGESAGAHTVALSEPSPSACGSGGGAGEVSCRAAAMKLAGAEFVGASEDGSNAFFLSTQQLTDGASEDPDSVDNAAKLLGCLVTVGVNGCNLYLYEGVTAEEASDRRLVDVSEGEGVVAGGPRVQGVVAVSPEASGERIYFVAQGVLTGKERPGCTAEWAAAGRGEEAVCHAVDGAENLYVYDVGTHSLAFITDMTGNDSPEWAAEPGTPANVTPDGQFLVFLSHGQPTADDTNRSGAYQVFRYDAATGSLLRMSIGNAGFDDDGNRSSATQCSVPEDVCSEDAYIVQGSRASRPDPTMADNGLRVFFESPVALTAHALEDVEIAVGGEIFGGHENFPVYAQNVYEWEAEGVGSCPPGRATGCVYLISDGRDVSVNRGGSVGCSRGSSTCLLGSDATGDNVFITTADSLVASDTNTELDYYDARVCEPEDGDPCVEAGGTLAPGCSGEECRGLPGASTTNRPAASSTFSGPGNEAPAVTTPPKAKVLTRAQKLTKALKVCRTKRNKHKRAVCEAQARKRYGLPHKAKKPAKAKRFASGRGGR